jgi:hypothetical protein
MEDQDLRKRIRKLVHEEHELFRQEAQGAATHAQRERMREVEEYLTSAGIFSGSVERNEPQASIPKLRTFAMSKQLSTTTNEGRTRRPLIVDMYLSLSDALPRVALASGVRLFTEARSTRALKSSLGNTSASLTFVHQV